MSGYTALMQQNEQLAKVKHRRLMEVLEASVSVHHGKILQYYGDGTLSIFDSALDAVRSSIAIQKELQADPSIPIRIGIHTGPVITGVVGLKKFTYDIWGDAVNMAARMEQHGEAGKINISGSTYDLIKDKFICTPRGKIQAKNKGEIDMYFVSRSLGEG